MPVHHAAFAVPTAVPIRPRLAVPPARRPRARLARLVMTALNPKRALVAVATGSEEIETSTVVDILVRAGAAVTVASVQEETLVTMSRGMRFAADTTFAELPADAIFDLIVLPGGMPGAENLSKCKELETRVRAAVGGDGGAVVGAICAAPGVCLGGWGLLEGVKATGYPAGMFVDMVGAGYVDSEDVVVSEGGGIVTSRGPATAMAFALKLVEVLHGGAVAEKLAEELLFAKA